MAKRPRLPRSWIDAPAAIVAVVVLILLIGIGVIMQSEAAYRDLQEQETRVQAEILAASVTAALDFEDRVAANEAVSAIRVNRHVEEHVRRAEPRRPARVPGRSPRAGCAHRCR